MSTTKESRAVITPGKPVGNNSGSSGQPVYALAVFIGRKASPSP
jgi:hypothetical protein